MKKNMGTIDKMLRVLIAVIIAVLYYLDIIVSGTLAIVLLFVAALLLVTSLLNFCPLFFVLGIKTSNRKTTSSDD